MAEIRGQETQPPAYGNGRRWAVLVGVNEYGDKDNYGSLHVCVNDATNIRNVLITGGFETSRIHLLTDKEPKKPLKEEIVAQLHAVAEGAEPNDLLLFYFSGHGVEEKGESYLVPCNGKGIALYDTALPLKRIKEIIDETKAGAKVIILDACHSGANIGTKGPGLMPEGFIERVFGQATGLAVLTSCRQGEQSHEWTEKNCSVYTYYLLEALQGKADSSGKGFVTVSDVNQYTVDKVVLWASQRQVRQRPSLNYFVDGEILLIRYQKLDTSSVTEEVSQKANTLEVPSERDYLMRLQEIAQSALVTFTSSNVWGSDCQPILQTLNQIVFPAIWKVLSSSSFAESPLYSIIVQLHYIDEQKGRVSTLINKYIQDQQGGAKRRGTQTKEIKSIFTSLVQSIEDVQKSIGSLEDEQIIELVGDDIFLKQQKDLMKYIGGDIRALREIRVSEQITDQFIGMGARPKKNEQVLHEDFFARFKRIPLHALFLCTLEDQEIRDYVLKYWGMLGDISKEFCDFHPMLTQFNDTESGYGDIWKLDVVRQSGFQLTADLPAIFFHDDRGVSEYVSLATATSEGDIKRIIRVVFDAIRQQPTIASVTYTKQLLGQQSRPLEGGVFLPSMDGKDASSMSDNISIQHGQLIEELRQLPSGEGKSYEELVKRVLAFCLADDFASFSIKEQVRIYNQKRIRDFIIDNRDSKVGFWRDLKVVRGVEKILFDTKNYGNAVSYVEITSTLRYLKSKAFGNFMIIVSRQGIKDWAEVVEDYIDEGKVVLFLDDSDLITLIEKKEKGERASSLIEEKYYNFLDMK